MGPAACARATPFRARLQTTYLPLRKAAVLLVIQIANMKVQNPHMENWYDEGQRLLLGICRQHLQATCADSSLSRSSCRAFGHLACNAED